ncbi:hypothetical protein GOV12_00080 [Candidatus Pacearchaeota archaeon]|nr:hypothetical protein [Candidatus Pacearchaeota archaeon]
MNFTYDGNGNLITGDGKFREYNEFNQLIGVYEGNDSSGDLLEEYIWHPTEDRILLKKVHLDEMDGPEETIVYVNDNFVRRYDLEGIREINDTYYIKNGGQLLAEIEYNGTIHTPIFSEVRKLYYHGDHLGSTSAITNESGDLIEQTFYDPYGKILGGGIVSRFDYEGKEFSSITEDYDFNFRKYNPELMIFTQPDSEVQNIYDPQNLNRYTFERNNPYKYVDPDGKEYREGAGLISIKKRWESYLYNKKELEKEFDEIYIKPEISSIKSRGNGPYYFGPSRRELIKNWKRSKLSTGFDVIIVDGEIEGYEYEGVGITSMDMVVDKGFSTNLVQNEITIQFETTTGKKREISIIQHIGQFLLMPDNITEPINDFFESIDTKVKDIWDWMTGWIK